MRIIIKIILTVFLGKTHLEWFFARCVEDLIPNIDFVLVDFWLLVEFLFFHTIKC